MSENGEIYTAGKNFTLPPALTALTNSTSDVKSQFALRATLRSVVGDKFCCKKLPRNFPPSGDGLVVATHYQPTKLQNTKGICHLRWLGHSILHDASDSLITLVLTSSTDFSFLRSNISAILWINSLFIPLECCKVYLTNASSKRFRPTVIALLYSVPISQ